MDVAGHVLDFLGKDKTMGERMKGGDTALLPAFIEAGMKGQKDKKGFYVYDKKNKKTGKNPEAAALLKAASERLGRPTVDVSDDELKDRLLGKMLNEAIYCLQVWPDAPSPMLSSSRMRASLSSPRGHGRQAHAAWRLSSRPITFSAFASWKQRVELRALRQSFGDNPVTYLGWCVVFFGPPLQDGIIESPTDGNIGMMFGCGFAIHTGGPFHYLDTLGAQTFVDKMSALADKLGPQFAPAQLIVDNAKAGKTFF